MTRTAPYGLLVLVLLGCAGVRYSGGFSPSDGDWTTMGGGNDRSHGTARDLHPPFTEVWRYSAQGGMLAAPLVRDSIVVVVTMHGELQLVRLADGRRLGYESMGAPMHGTPVLNGSNVVLTLSAAEGSVRLFGLREGRAIWRSSPGPVETSPLLVGDTLIVTTLAGTVAAFNVSQGEEQWNFAPATESTRRPFHTAPVQAGNLVVCGSDDGTVYAVSTRTGENVWRHRMKAAVFSTSVVVRGRVVVADLSGTVRALDASTGGVLWEYTTGAPVYAPIAGDGVSVYVASSDGSVRALRVEDGELLWNWSAGAVVNAAPLVSPSYVYVGSLGRKFFVLNKENGSEVWSLDLEGRMKVSPVIWGNTLLLSYEDKTIAAFVPQGKER